MKHGKCDTRLYRIWTGMKSRCYNKNNKRYSHYGGRDIIVCDGWRNNFQAFYDWAIKNGYDDTLTIDRINNDGDYEPSNCRWVTWDMQAKNKSNLRYITINGETHYLKEWCNLLGLKYPTVKKRIYSYHWDVYRALGVK